MTGYVVDASVAVKWLVTEAFSDQAIRLLDRELTLVAPELLFAKAANALWAMCRRGDISKADFAERWTWPRPGGIDLRQRARARAPGRLQL